MCAQNLFPTSTFWRLTWLDTLQRRGHQKISCATFAQNHLATNMLWKTTLTSTMGKERRLRRHCAICVPLGQNIWAATWKTCTEKTNMFSVQIVDPTLEYPRSKSTRSCANSQRRRGRQEKLRKPRSVTSVEEFCAIFSNWGSTWKFVENDGRISQIHNITHATEDVLELHPSDLLRLRVYLQILFVLNMLSSLNYSKILQHICFTCF